VKTELRSLELIQIASPCDAAWDEMAGDKRVRFCQHCKLHVYNLSEMERGEAEAFIDERTGRTCVRLYRRQDGTVLTKDCPVGWRAVRQRLVRAVAALAAMIVAMVTGTLLGGIRKPSSSLEISSAFARWIDPDAVQYVFVGVMFTPNVQPTAIMGGCPAPPSGLVTPPNSIAAADPAESPLPPPTAEQLEQIQQRIEQ
jgi:hypothetical protein